MPQRCSGTAFVEIGGNDPGYPTYDRRALRLRFNDRAVAKYSGLSARRSCCDLFVESVAPSTVHESVVAGDLLEDVRILVRRQGDW